MESETKPVVERLEKLMKRIIDELEVAPTRTVLKFIFLIVVTACAIRFVRRVLP